MKQDMGKKTGYSLLVLAIFGMIMLILTHTAQNGVRTTEVLPGINPDPVYVTCEEGEPLGVSLQAKGKWFLISGNAAFVAGQEYVLSVLADGSSPYFMQVPAGEGDVLPFAVQVNKDGKILECGISLESAGWNRPG